MGRGDVRPEVGRSQQSSDKLIDACSLPCQPLHVKVKAASGEMIAEFSEGHWSWTGAELANKLKEAAPLGQGRYYQLVCGNDVVGTTKTLLQSHTNHSSASLELLATVQ